MCMSVGVGEINFIKQISLKSASFDLITLGEVTVSLADPS